MDNLKLKKFLPVLDSPMWGRLEDDILKPELELALQDLENDVKSEQTRGKIKFIRMLLALPKNALTMRQENL